MWSQGNNPALRVGVQTSIATLEISVAVSQKTENWSALRSIYTIPGHIPKGHCTILPEHLYKYVYSSAISKSQDLVVWGALLKLTLTDFLLVINHE